MRVRFRYVPMIWICFISYALDVCTWHEICVPVPVSGNSICCAFLLTLVACIIVDSKQ